MKSNQRLLVAVLGCALPFGAVTRAEQSGSGRHTPGQTSSFIDALRETQYGILGGDFAFAANGYSCKQFTRDSGSGARLGSFEGQTIGVGPVVSCILKGSKADFVAEVKWLHEVKVSNRLEGDYVWFKMGIVF